jgi:hypothetical protein
MSARIYLLTMFLALSGVAQAVEFDANLKAPRAVSGLDLKNRLNSVAARISGPGAINALDAVRDRSLARERFDARWMLGTMIDERVPLPELEELGIKAKGDGSYSIDERLGQWRSLADNLVLLKEANMASGLEAVLLARGFRPDDYVALRTYIDGHDLKREREQRQLALAISTSKMAKKLQKLKRLDDNFMASYFYQKAWDAAETDRRWASGLLDALEPQAQRILASYFGEMTSTGYIAPTPTADAYKYERDLLLQPDFERQAKTAFAEGRL